jgi:hypothetical protein
VRRDERGSCSVRNTIHAHKKENDVLGGKTDSNDCKNSQKNTRIHAKGQTTKKRNRIHAKEYPLFLALSLDDLAVLGLSLAGLRQLPSIVELSNCEILNLCGNGFSSFISTSLERALVTSGFVELYATHNGAYWSRQKFSLALVGH